MGSKSRQFGEVFSIAQGILRKTWGMELVELQQQVQEKFQIQEQEAQEPIHQCRSQVELVARVSFHRSLQKSFFASGVQS